MYTVSVAAVLAWDYAAAACKDSTTCSGMCSEQARLQAYFCVDLKEITRYKTRYRPPFFCVVILLSANMARSLLTQSCLI